MYKSSKLALLVMLFGSGGQVFASTSTAGVGGQGTNITTTLCTLGPSPASGDFSGGGGAGSTTGDASAFSNQNLLGGSATASAIGAQGSSNVISTTFCTSAIIDDIFICGPTDTASIQASAELNGTINLSGTNSVNDATSRVEARIQITTGSGLPGVFDEGLGQPQTNEVIATTITTGASTVPTGTNITVQLTLEGRALINSNTLPGTFDAQLDFSNGLTFPTSGSVFTLPAGFSASSIDGNIIDNQFDASNNRSVVSVTATDPAASETGPDSGTFTITRSSVDICQPLTVNFTLSGIAINGTDYTNTLLTVNFASGETAPKTVTILPIDDSEVEGDETVILTLTPGSNYSVGSNANATVIIADNDSQTPTLPTSPNNVEPTTIPTLSEWGIILLILMIFIIGSKRARIVKN